MKDKEEGIVVHMTAEGDPVVTNNNGKVVVAPTNPWHDDVTPNSNNNNLTEKLEVEIPAKQVNGTNEDEEDVDHVDSATLLVRGGKLYEPLKDQLQNLDEKPNPEPEQEKPKVCHLMFLLIMNI